MTDLTGWLTATDCDSTKMQLPSEDTAVTMNRVFQMNFWLFWCFEFLCSNSHASRGMQSWGVCVWWEWTQGYEWVLHGFCACGVLPGSLWLRLAECSRFLELIREMDNSSLQSSHTYASFLLSHFQSFTLSGALSLFSTSFSFKTFHCSPVLGKLI